MKIMNEITPLVGISLAGFQVFDELTYIPLDRLTFIFGPNSAGKSSIQDAIDLVRILQSSDRLFSEPGGGLSAEDEKKIARHRRVKFNELSEDVGETHIYVKSKCTTQLDRVIALAANKKIASTELKYPLEIEDRWIISSGFEYEQIINDESILKIGTGLFQVNLDHPIFKNIDHGVDFYSISNRFKDVFLIEKGWLNFLVYLEGFKINGSGIQSSGGNWLRLGKYNENSGNNSPELFEAIGCISLIIGYLMKFTNGALNFQWTNVEASRQVPKPPDLTYSLFYDNADFSMPPLSGNDRYRNLAFSLAATYFENQNPPIPIPFDWDNLGKNNITYLAAEINRALSEHLFLEKGYRVDFEYRVILNDIQSEALMRGLKFEGGSPKLLVRLNLIDSDGRKLLFEDVGSGIGYVLPVLCAAYEKSNKRSLRSKNYDQAQALVATLRHPGYREDEILGDLSSACFIQQPELHLHPALQASLGDVFIEGSASGNQLLVETHSEHLLLRILRRIRQTHQESAISPELKLNSQEVCVLYFQPVAGGVTKVRRLRISEGGEFMDRWPDGFFPERDRELLDE